jgi:hypothetical protein
LRLSEDAPIGKDVYPAQLPKDDFDQFIGRNVQIGGWGKLGKESDGLPTFTETTVVSNSECDKIWSKWDYSNRISDELLCTDVSDSARSVSGDSGGKYKRNENFLKKLFQKKILIGGQLVQFATAQIAIGRNYFSTLQKKLSCVSTRFESTFFKLKYFIK